MTTKKDKSAFFQILEQLEAQTTTGTKGFKFLKHPSNLVKYALNTKGQVSIVTSMNRNDVWVSTIKQLETHKERINLMLFLENEHKVISNMETYNASLKEVTKAKKEGKIKSEYALF